MRRNAGCSLLKCAPDLVPGDDAFEPAVGVDRHQRAQPREGLASEKGLERIVGADSEAVTLAPHDLVHPEDGLPVLGDSLRSLAVDDADEVAAGVDDREPRI